MQFHSTRSNRRTFLGATVATTAALWTPGAFAEALTRTPAQTEGPFYPDRLPLDTDNDLLVLNDSLTPAVGEVTHLTGRVLTVSGSPVANASVEIWQCDAHGNYIHSRGAPSDPDSRDSGFQGFGRFLTSRTGEYYFRTIKPVPYPGRAPHIHVIVRRGDKRLLTTQCYIAGHELNERDGILRRITDKQARQSIVLPFEKIPDSKLGELTANFDIVLGITPDEEAAG